MIDAVTVANTLEKSDVYIHPAIIDNSPNSLCEAQVVGCPVIAANVGGIASLVENGKTGLLYPYNEPHMLAFEIMKLRSESGIAREMSKNEIKVATKRHDPETIYEHLLETYNFIVVQKK